MRRAALAALAALAGCGGDDRPGELVVSAAASLKGALTECSGAGVRLQFAGSDELAAQIRRGVRPDVYAAADTELPERLAREGRLERPVAFATNRLVIAASRGSGVDALDDLARPGRRLAIGSEGVPVGDYAREAIARLDPERARAIRGNVRSEEPDVKGIVGKLTQGAVDAGLVYATDAAAAGLRTVPLPARLQPSVAYGAGVVTGTDAPERARAYVAGLTRGTCAGALRAAGFGAPR